MWKEELGSIKGVKEVFLFTRSGRVLWGDDREDVRRVGRGVALSFEFLHKVKKEVDFLEFIFDKEKVLAMRGEDFYLAVRCEEEADLSMLKISMNVAKSQIKGEKGLMKAIKRDKGFDERTLEEVPILMEIWHKVE
ncbi:hypothetical protein DRO34_04205 [Candidatus Bathyarchaeota archaeon]|nr:MAG: hypothetical protein DRO34_04205 [Candidatus Bathyarchaeota archaeon]